MTRGSAVKPRVRDAGTSVLDLVWIVMLLVASTSLARIRRARARITRKGRPLQAPWEVHS